MADLYASVMEHARKFKDVTSTQGAFAFNQRFEGMGEEQEVNAPPQIKVEIIDAVQRKQEDWSGMMEQSYVEYLIKLYISESKIKIVGKRYSELSDLHTQLVERQFIHPKKSPPFPDKSIAHGNWWKFNEKDPASEFVQQRKDALNAYLQKLFNVNPGLAYEPFVMVFFELEELSVEAALAESLKTAKEVRRGSQLAASAPPIAPNSLPSANAVFGDSIQGPQTVGSAGNLVDV